MKYTDVVKFMKHAASEWDDAIEKERQRRLAISKGDPKIEAMFDAGARQRAAKSQANRIADNNMRAEFDAIQKGKTTARANSVNAEIARQQKADALVREKAMSGTTTSARPDTLHASPSTAGKRTGAAEAARVKANREFQIRDAARQDAALANGTMKTNGSGSITVGGKTTSFGQPIQRDPNGISIKQPASNATVKGQSRINGVVYDRMSDGTMRQNQQATKYYEVYGQMPPKQQPQAQPKQQVRRPVQQRPAATPANNVQQTQAGKPQLTTRPIQQTTTRTNISANTGTVGSKATVGTKARPTSVRR